MGGAIWAFPTFSRLKAGEEGRVVPGSHLGTFTIRQTIACFPHKKINDYWKFLFLQKAINNSVSFIIFIFYLYKNFPWYIQCILLKIKFSSFTKGS